MTHHPIIHTNAPDHRTHPNRLNRLSILTFALCISLFHSCKTAEHTAGTTEIRPFEHLHLHQYSKAAALKDLDLLVHSLKEAHTGLYWYTNERAFDSLVSIQRAAITGRMNSLELYNVFAPIVAFTKEDHCDIMLSEATSAYLKKTGKFMPLVVVSLDEQIYLLNDPDTNQVTRGYRLLAIDGQPIDRIYAHIFQTFAADGFITSSKYRYLDRYRFAREYGKTIGQPDSVRIEVENPATGERKILSVKTTNTEGLTGIGRQLQTGSAPAVEEDKPATLEWMGETTALLTFNTFSNSKYKAAGMNFKTFVTTAFDTIRSRGIKDLVIDMRENGGGSEGNEDFLFAFLTDHAYQKYRYVQLSAFTFSFLDHTDYAARGDRRELEEDLEREHYRTEEGIIIRKPGIEPPEPPKEHPYAGKIYVLTSGWTYSGGAEFCSLMKQHTNAVFIGEEVGGGYYGNTSGYILELTLPHSGIRADIPILKFVLDVDGVPFGRGVIPDYPLQPTIDAFLRGEDVQLELAKQLIRNSQ